MKIQLTAQQIKENWDIFLNYIETGISSPRKEKLLGFYKKHQEEIILMPASNKRSYHNAIPGGYIDHVNRVIKGALELHKVWDSMGAYTNTYSIEELIFSALNHDLGKMGDGENYSYLPSNDNWRKENLGETYQFNLKIPYMTVPDRSLFLLHQNGIEVSYNEWISIKTHDGLYDQGNEAYLKSFMPETKPRTCLPYLIHQADLMAARIEFEHEYLDELNQGGKLVKRKPSNTSPKTQALKNITTNTTTNFNNVVNDFFK